MQQNKIPKQLSGRDAFWDPKSAILRWIFKLGLEWKLLIANFIIFILWCGVIISSLWLYDWRSPQNTLYHLGSLIVLLLTGGNIIVNFLYIRLFLTPLKGISNVIDGVRKGDVSLLARAHLTGGSITPRCVMCADSFNNMLDLLAAKQQLSQQLAQRVISAQEEERKRISRELHDEASQLLTTLSIRLEQLKQSSFCLEKPVLQNELDSLRSLTQQILVEIRRLAFNLRPTMLDNLGLRHALFWLFREQVQKKGIQVQFVTEGEEIRLPDTVELTLFRVSQEAATNVVKYAKANLVRVFLLWSPTLVCLEVSDDGVGFNVDKELSLDGSHMGLIGMKERLELLSGTFDVISFPGQGTTVKISVPVKGFAGTKLAQAIASGSKSND